MAALDEVRFRRLLEQMSLCLDAVEACERELRSVDALPTSLWANLEYHLSRAREAVSEAELDIVRPARPHRREIEALAVECDRLLNFGHVRR